MKCTTAELRKLLDQIAEELGYGDPANGTDGIGLRISWTDSEGGSEEVVARFFDLDDRDMLHFEFLDGRTVMSQPIFEVSMTEDAEIEIHGARKIHLYH